MYSLATTMERSDSNTTQVIPASNPEKRFVIWKAFSVDEKDGSKAYCTVEDCLQREVKRGTTATTKNTTNLW